MDELIEKIEEAVNYLFRAENEKFEKLAGQLVDAMMAIFPAIIASYNDPRMSDLREDATYWPGQLERIIASFEKGDLFEITDVLYNETRPNLMEIRDTLKERGII